MQVLHTHTYTHTHINRGVNHARQTASLSGTVRVRLLAQGHLENQLGGVAETN